MALVDTTVGVIGLGAMGGPIAGHLIDAGCAVVVHDLDEARVSSCVKRGAVAAADAAEVAARCGIVILVLPTDDDVRLLSVDVLLPRMAAGSTLLVCSSVRPDTCRGLLDAAGDRVSVLDAALTGGVRGAEDGQINLLVGGDGAALDRVRPWLRPWTRGVHHLGPIGAGQVGKTVNNLIHWAQIVAITEGFELARRYGLDLPTVRRALTEGPTDSRTLRELQHMRFTWWKKDLENADLMAGDVGWHLYSSDSSGTRMPDITVARMESLLAGRDPEFTDSPGDR